MRKRFLIISGVFITLIFLIAVFLRPLIIFIANEKLRDIFPEASANISSIDINFPDISLVSVEVNTSFYKVRVKNIILSLKEKNVEFDGIGLNIDMPDKTFKRAKEMCAESVSVPASGKGRPWDMYFRDADINIKSEDIDTEFKANMSFNGAQGRIETLAMDVSKLRIGKISFKDAVLNKAGTDIFEFYIADIGVAEKIKIRDVSGRMRFADNVLSSDEFSGRMWDGNIKGKMSVDFGSGGSYRLDIKGDNMALETLLSQLRMSDKLDMKGKASGDIAIAGKGKEVRILDGAFHVINPPGIMTVKDEALLRRIAQNTGQPYEFVKEAFTDYLFDTGDIATGIKGDKLDVSINMDGKKGRRDLYLTLHDFSGDLSVLNLKQK